eukprot:GFYU01011686.1.p1 GENE.GFYU01011686.1~~GFYU01011686.1.p1  ORF type:complete len:205 (+),score=18.36 GFYU01011686.1:366-980(+)
MHCTSAGIIEAEAKKQLKNCAWCESTGVSKCTLCQESVCRIHTEYEHHDGGARGGSRTYNWCAQCRVLNSGLLKDRQDKMVVAGGCVDFCGVSLLCCPIAWLPQMFLPCKKSNARKYFGEARMIRAIEESCRKFKRQLNSIPVGIPEIFTFQDMIDLEWTTDSRGFWHISKATYRMGAKLLCVIPVPATAVVYERKVRDDNAGL